MSRVYIQFGLEVVPFQRLFKFSKLSFVESLSSFGGYFRLSRLSSLKVL